LKYALEAMIGVIGAIAMAAAGAHWPALLIGGAAVGVLIVVVEFVAAAPRKRRGVRESE
jgi:membrane-associated phospholipid phosphatase